jgi:phospholipase/carboxylesterase
MRTGDLSRDDSARLDLRTVPAAGLSAPPGTSPLGLGEGRDGLLHVPRSVASAGPSPLVVALHGAGGTGAQMVHLLKDAAEEHGVLLLAPDSRDRTWDLITDRGYGVDVEFCEEALRVVLGRCPVDLDRMAIGGFSDGASYALSLGISNGDVFGHVLAYSPGFAAPAAPVGRPALFVSHGTDDRVLSIDRCSRRLVPALRRSGYEVEYREFHGGHVVPDEILDESLRWLRSGPESGRATSPPARRPE